MLPGLIAYKSANVQARAPADASGGTRGVTDGRFRQLPVEATDLAALLWTTRPLLIFAPTPEDAAYHRQLDLLHEDKPGLRERDVLVLTDTDPEAGCPLRAEYASDAFTVLLFGKDGSLKLRGDEPVGIEDLFALIDEMPMRRREAEEARREDRQT